MVSGFICGTGSLPREEDDCCRKQTSSKMIMSSFICGTSSLPREEDDCCQRQTRSADSSPTKSRSRSSGSKNPYSTRGLDKFSALLAEIEEKRQQIYSQVDPDEISLVRFVVSGDHGFKPIVVKSKPQLDKQSKIVRSENLKGKSHPLRKLSSSSSMVAKVENKAKNDTNKMVLRKKKMSFFKVNNWKEPKLYLPIAFILILVFVVLFGRSFAIMCTSIGWYVIPTIANNNATSTTSMSFKKKDPPTRRLSEKRLLLTKSFKSFDGKSQQQNGHRRSI